MKTFQKLLQRDLKLKFDKQIVKNFRFFVRNLENKVYQKFHENFFAIIKVCLVLVKVDQLKLFWGNQ